MSFESLESFRYFLNQCTPDSLYSTLESAKPVEEYQNNSYFLYLAMTILYIKDQKGLDIIAKNGYTFDKVLLKFQFVPGNLTELYQRHLVKQETIQTLFKGKLQKHEIEDCLKLLHTNLIKREYCLNLLVLNYLELEKNENEKGSMSEWILQISQKADFIIALFLRNLINYDYLIINTSQAYIVAMLRGYRKLSDLISRIRYIRRKRTKFALIKLRTIAYKRKTMKELLALPTLGQFPGGSDYLQAKERLTLLWQSQGNSCS